MSIKFLRGKGNTFQVSVGEEGAVVVYTQDGYAKAKMFVRSTEEVDTEKLRELLAKDKDARIHIYLDTLDQTYVQRTLPAVGAMSVQKLAFGRLEKEIPKGHIKTCVQIGRSPTGRHDWIYSFISTSYEAPVSTWVEFFLPFRNVISGIYFLPIEVYSIVARLKSIALKENQFQQKKKTSLIDTIMSSIKPSQSADLGRWEVYLSQNKTGGFRQVAYQDGKIIFSRLLNNINDPSPDVVAGNIEQEVANSIEYMSRLSLGSDQEIDVYLILSSDILKYLRKEKIKATNLITYTPHALAEKIKVPEASTEKDKFSDPTVLTALSKVPSKLQTLHTAVTAKVSKTVFAIDFVSTFLVFVIPACLLAILYFASNIIELRGSMSQVKIQAKNFEAQLNEQKKTLDSSEEEIKENISAIHLIEIVDNYAFFNSLHKDPFIILNKLSRILPSYARAKVIKWIYDEPKLLNPSAPDSITSLSLKRSYTMSVEVEVLMIRSGNTYEELEQKYTSFVQSIKTTFKDFDLVISDMPQNFSFQEQESSAPMVIKVQMSFPKVAGNSNNPNAPFRTSNLGYNRFLTEHGGMNVN
jgi:cell division protein FtsL